MIRLLLCGATALSALVCLVPSHASNDNVLELGDMLPSGHWGARYDLRYQRADRQFNADRQRQEIAADSNHIPLDATAVPQLAALGPGATLGTTALDVRVEGQRHRLTLAYAANNDLSIGVGVPYGDMRTKANFAVIGGNLAFNPSFNPQQPVSPSNPPLVPVGTFGTSQPVGTEGVQQILTSAVYGYNYQRLASTEASGLLDPTLGARWRFWTNDRAAATFTPGLRLGMTKQDDPDNLFDAPMDDGSTDLLLGLAYMQRLGTAYDLRGTLNYTYQTADHVTARARSSSEILAPASRKERMRRDLGDILEASMEGGRRFGDWRGYTSAEFFRKKRDSYVSPSGQDVGGLEQYTQQSFYALRLGMDWNGVRAFRSGELPLPLLISLDYRRIVRASNTIDMGEVLLAFTGVF